jgi:GTP cyclohydrolase II
MRCDCGSQLHEALKRIAEQQQGILLYLRQEGRGIGLLNKLKAYNLQDQGVDTVEANIKLGFGADERNYDMVKPMLHHLGAKSICLMTNNLGKMQALTDLGIAVDGREAIQVGKNSHNHDYLMTKARKMQHVLD